jgi:hypothetical protein
VGLSTLRQMSRLYLRCVICSRQQAEGLISGASWGRLELPADVSLNNPALVGSTLRACPSCIGGDPHWQHRVLASLGISAEGFSVRIEPTS